VTIYAEATDGRSWLDERSPSPDRDSLDLHQAYLALGDPAECPISLKIGRQEMNYGDQRFIGVSDWGNIRRAFDAAKVRYEKESFWVDAFVGRVVIPHDEHFNVANDYDWFSGIYFLSRRLVPKQETEIYFLARNVGAGSPNAIAPGLGGPGPRDIYTPGLRVRYTPGKFGGWDHGAEVAGQFGNISGDGERIEHVALAAAALAGYTWTNAFGSPRVGVEYTYASGDSDPADDRHETFELLPGTNHRFYGAMDLFGLRNIHNPSITFSMKPAKSLSLRLDGLAFWVADGHDFLYPESGSARSGNGYGINPQFDPYVGSELDILVDYQPRPWVELRLGYGHFFVGDYIKQSVGSVAANNGAVDGDWFYAQMRFNF